jgi:5'-3' exonuclease
VGIDILGFLYRAKAQGVYPIVYVAQLMAFFKRQGIEPVCVFDGKPPIEKQRVLEQRTTLRVVSRVKKTAMLQTAPKATAAATVQELQKLELNSTYFTSDERDQVKQFLYACGVLSLNASGEADNMLAYFSRKGWVAAVLSSDFDLLARGVETLIMPDVTMTSSMRAADDDALVGTWKQYTLSTILRHTDLSYAQFAEMCALMGSDYTAGMPTVHYKTAYWTVKQSGAVDYTLARYHVTDTRPYARAKHILMGTEDTEETLMNSKQWEKWHDPHPVVELDALREFVRVYFPPAAAAAATATATAPPCTSNILIGNGRDASDRLFDDLSKDARTVGNYTAAACA